MNPDPLYVPEDDDEPWRVVTGWEHRSEPRWLTALRIVSVAVVLAVIALVARR